MLLSQEKVFENYKEHIKEKIGAILGKIPEDLDIRLIVQDCINPVGKLIRPRLVIFCGAFGEKFSEKKDRLSSIAAMVELTHISSLIHDDIVDDGLLRRGKPSVQSKYGKDAAVYAGDYIMANINRYACENGLSYVNAVISKAVEKMCLGEIRQAVSKYKLDIDKNYYFKSIYAKTAVLIKAACALGAAETGCDSSTVKILEKFGEKLGILFQIRDDLLDFTSDRSHQGKLTHSDFRNGIYTLPIIKTLENKEGYKKLRPIMEKNKKEHLSEDDIKIVENCVFSHGGIYETKKVIYSLKEDTLKLLRELNNKKIINLMENIIVELGLNDEQL